MLLNYCDFLRRWTVYFSLSFVASEIHNTEHPFLKKSIFMNIKNIFLYKLHF